MVKYAEIATHRQAVSEASVGAGEVALGSRAALAEWLGTQRSQVTRAGKGQKLTGEVGWRLASLAAVVTALLSFLEADAVAGWMAGNNPHLGDRRPLEVLAAGDVAAVMAAAQAARTGVFA